MRIGVFLLFSIFCRLTYAQCCSGGVPMSGNLGMPTADKGVFQTSFNYDFNNLETLKEGTNTLDDKSRNRQTHSFLWKFGYSITSKIAIDGFLSHVTQTRIIREFGNTNVTRTQGIGDGVLMLKYRLSERFTVGYGLKVPLGATNKKSLSGFSLNADLQPGSGAWDHIGYFNYSAQTQFRPSLTYFSTAIYRHTGLNNNYFGDATYEFGNETQIILGASDRLVVGSFIVDPSLKLRFRNAGRDLFMGNEFPSSGGRFVFVSPAITWQISEILSYQLSAELPIYADVIDTQLSPTYRINTGINLVIKPKSKIEFKI